MRLCHCFLLLYVSVSPALGLPQSDHGQTAMEVVIPSRGGHLAGTLTLPVKGAGPFGVALSLTGSGPHFRDGNRTPTHPYRPFREIAAALARKGVAMLRLDDRGVGKSSGDANAATGDDIADDASFAIAWLRSRPEIDPARVGIVGHSFGGEVAPLVAAKDPRLAAVVLMGAPAVNFRETMRYQHRYRIENDARIPESGRAAALEAAMRQQELNVAASVERWRPWAQNRDPLLAARRVRCPVLILQGTTDRAVAPENATLLAQAVRGGGNTRVTLKVFESVNHHFQIDPVGATDRYDELPSQTLAPAFLETISLWLADTLKPAPGGRQP